MEPKSSKETYVEGLIRSFLEANEPFVAKRHIVWPKEMFIELTLSPKQTQTVRRWLKQKHSVMPRWFANCERVLFIDQETYEEWLLKKDRNQP